MTRPSSADSPVTTIATILHQRDDLRTFQLILKNGKHTLGHLPKKLDHLKETLTADDRVTVEMTPFDFEKARITSKVS